ncbi:hypothetical protein BC834DRAFT_844723 [Gloeopeniophorella convolvens]|nr:hypothetical protein BC834DRAFT_844723 [Gloeopeniophorella convolvens]
MQHPSSSTHNFAYTLYVNPLPGEHPITVKCYSDERVDRWIPEASLNADLQCLLMMDVVNSMPPTDTLSAEDFLNEIASSGTSSGDIFQPADLASAAQTPEDPFPTYVESGSNSPEPSQPFASLAQPMGARALQTSGSSTLHVPQLPAHSLPSTSSQAASYATTTKISVARPRTNGQCVTPEALEPAGLQQGVQRQPAARASASTQRIFEQAGHAVESPWTSTIRGVHAASLPKTLYVQGSPDIIKGPPPAFEDIMAALNRREPITVALPSIDVQVVRGPGKCMTILAPRERVFLSTELQSSHGDRPWRCKMCPKMSAQRHNFARHCRSTIKHPETLYFCERCWEPFAREDACKAHFNSQEGSRGCVTLSKEDGKRRLEYEMELLCGYEAFLIPRLLRGQWKLPTYKQWVNKAKIRLQVLTQTGTQ